MLKLIKGRFAKTISILALACFLCSPLGYIATLPTASAASYSYDAKHDNPPPHKDKERHNKDNDDDDDDYSKGNIVTAVLVGGVIGAIIAKNT